MTSEAPLITIAMTAWNAEDTIARALDSALAQDWRPSEILVYDDCSADGTTAILQDYARRHAGAIRLLRGAENIGVAGARNVLIEQAKGAFIAFFDDDDESAPGRLSRQYERIVAYERDYAGGAPVICHSARLQVFADERQRYVPVPGAAEDAPAPCGLAVAKYLLYGRPLPGQAGILANCAQMARREVYERLGGYDAGYRRWDDTEFLIRLAKAGGHFPGIADPLVTQQVTGGSDKTRAIEMQQALRCLEKHRDVVVSARRYRFARSWLKLRCLYFTHERARFAAGFLMLALRHPVMLARRIWWGRRV